MKKNKSKSVKIATMTVGEQGNIKLNINDEEVIHRPESTLVVDARDSVCEFDETYGHLLIQHEHAEFNKLTHTHHVLLNDGRRLRELVPHFKNQESIYPLVALLLLDDVIKNIIVHNSAFSTERIKDNVELIAPYIKDYQDDEISDADREKLNQIIHEMFTIFTPVLLLVFDYICDSPWNTFVYTRDVYTIRITKEMDYRIQDWMRLKKEGVI